MTIRILLIRNTHDDLKSFHAYFGSRRIEYRAVDYDRLSAASIPDSGDGIILSGTDYPPVDANLCRYTTELQLIRQVTVPLLGICGGMQLICRAWGGEIRRLATPLYGRIRVHWEPPGRLFAGLPQPCVMFARHVYAVNRVPAGFHVTAHSLPTAVPYAMRHHRKPVYGVQFHPERRNHGYRLLDNFLSLVEETGTAHGLNTRINTVDGKTCDVEPSEREELSHV